MINFLVEIYARGENPNTPPLRFLSAPLDPQNPARNSLGYIQYTKRGDCQFTETADNEDNDPNDEPFPLVSFNFSIGEAGQPAPQSQSLVDVVTANADKNVLFDPQNPGVAFIGNIDMGRLDTANVINVTLDPQSQDLRDIVSNLLPEKKIWFDPRYPGLIRIVDIDWEFLHRNNNLLQTITIDGKELLI